MENEQSRPAADPKKQLAPPPKPDGFLVALVKGFLNFNYLKWGIKKDF